MLAAWAAHRRRDAHKGLVGARDSRRRARASTRCVTRDFARLAAPRAAARPRACCCVIARAVVRRSCRCAIREFAHFFFVHEHVERFLTTEHQREGAWWYFVPLLARRPPAVDCRARVALRAQLARRAARAERASAGSASAWRGPCFVFVFFSVSGSKLPSYILPMFPAPWRSCSARAWPRCPMRAWSRLVALLAIASAGLAVAAWFGFDALAARLAKRAHAAVAATWRSAHGVQRGPAGHGASERSRAWLLDRAAAGASAHAVRAGGRARRARPALLLAFWSNRRARSAAARPPTSSPRRVSDAALRRDRPVLQVQLYDQTLPFYLGRTTTLVDYRDELALGLDAEPGKGIATTREWTERWQACARRRYALMAPRHRRRGSPPTACRCAVVARRCRAASCVARR